MNTAETTSENLTLDSLAAQILLSALTTAQRLNAGDTLLFLEAYDKICTIERTGSNVIKFTPQMAQASVNIKDCTVTGGAAAVNSSGPVLPDLGEPAPIQPIPLPTAEATPAPAKRTRRTQAQIEADNAAAAQATAPVEGNGSGETASTDLVPATGVSSGSPSLTESTGLPEGFDGVALSTLFKDINNSKAGEDKAAFITAVKAKLAEIGAPAVSKVAAEHIAAFRTFLLIFKA